MHNDEFHGQGGVYIINHDGTRTLMERTLEPWETPSHDPSADEPKPKAKAKIKKDS